jgi:hypothetical protein
MATAGAPPPGARAARLCPRDRPHRVDRGGRRAPGKRSGPEKLPQGTVTLSQNSASARPRGSQRLKDDRRDDPHDGGSIAPISTAAPPSLEMLRQRDAVRSLRRRLRSSVSPLSRSAPRLCRGVGGTASCGRRRSSPWLRSRVAHTRSRCRDGRFPRNRGRCDSLRGSWTPCRAARTAGAGRPDAPCLPDGAPRGAA